MKISFKHIILFMLAIIPVMASAAIPTPSAQWDVNVDGRTDDDLYERVNGTVESSTGAPAVDTAGTYDSLDYNGTNEYTNITTFPAGLSSTFVDSDYTIAVRFKIGNASPTDFESIFGVFKSGDGNDRIHIVLNTSTGAILGAHAGGTGGSSIFLSSGQTRTTSQEVVVVQRCDATDCSLWVDGTEYDTDSSTRPTMGAYDIVGFAARLDGDLGSQPWYYEGHIYWAAVWEEALSDSEIQELDDAENPFVSSAPTATIDDDTPAVGQEVTVTLSEALAGGNPTKAVFDSGDEITCTSATSTTCTFTFDRDYFVASGTLDNTPLGAATVLLEDGSANQSLTDSITISGTSGVHFGVTSIACDSDDTPQVCDAGTLIQSPIEQGDQALSTIVAGCSWSDLTTHVVPYVTGCPQQTDFETSFFDTTASSWTIIYEDSIAGVATSEECESGMFSKPFSKPFGRPTNDPLIPANCAVN